MLTIAEFNIGHCIHNIPGDAVRLKSEESSEQDLEALGNVWLKSSRELNARSGIPLPGLQGNNISEKDTFSKDSLEVGSDTR